MSLVERMVMKDFLSNGTQKQTSTPSVHLSSFPTAYQAYGRSHVESQLKDSKSKMDQENKALFLVMTCFTVLILSLNMGVRFCLISVFSCTSHIF